MEIVIHENDMAFHHQGRLCEVKALYVRPEGKPEEYTLVLRIKDVGERKIFAYEGLPFYGTDSPAGRGLTQRSPSAQSLIERSLDHAWSFAQNQMNDLLIRTVLEGKGRKTLEGKSV